MEPEKLSVFGELVRRAWMDLPKHYGNAVDEFVVMPNHVHGIFLELAFAEKMHALGTMIQGFSPTRPKKLTACG